MKKLKMNLVALTEISLICLAFFVFSPSLKAHAMFSDTANINMGIQLELGMVSMATEDTTISNAVSFTEGDPVLVASSTLINDGSLSGKLAYKIGVTKENGTVLNDEEIKDMSVIINFGTLAKEATVGAPLLKADGFTFARNNSGSEVIVEPDSVGKVPVKIKYKTSSPTKNEKLKVTVTFRLIQSNAADANAELFSDEETLANTVTLVPKVIEEKSYWPAASTFTNKSSNNKITYSLEKMDMVFSEVHNPKILPTKEIKNLNQAILYIQLPMEEDLKTTDYETGKQIDKYKLYSTTANGKDKVNVDKIELDEINHGYKVTFSLIDSYDSSNTNKVQEYNNKFNYQLHQTFQLYKYTFDGWNRGNYNNNADISLDKYDYASRLVLSTDMATETNAAHFANRVIPLSIDEKNIVIKQLKTMSRGWVENVNFKDVKWNKETVALEVKGGITGQIVSSLNLNIVENPNKIFSLWLKSNETLNNAVLNVKILGDAGNMLIIPRTLKNGILPSTNTATIQSTSRSLTSVPMIVEETEEPTEQAINPEKSVEVQNPAIDKTTPDEQAVESSIEESDANQVIDEAEVVEETKEAVESSDQVIPVK